MLVNEVDKAAFKAAVQPVWAEYEGVFGKELMDLVREYGD
jgi:TRAP-type C4-dicarboxylate transport system substrate-binding protein